MQKPEKICTNVVRQRAPPFVLNKFGNARGNR